MESGRAHYELDFLGLVSGWLWSYTPSERTSRAMLDADWSGLICTLEEKYGKHMHDSEVPGQSYSEAYASSSVCLVQISPRTTQFLVIHKTAPVRS